MLDLTPLQFRHYHVSTEADEVQTTYFLKHELPDLTGIGLAALGIKISCAVISLFLALIYLRPGSRWPERMQPRIWQILYLLGLTALMSAAFLRWYA